MKKKEQYFLDVQSSRQKARNNARQPGTAELHRKAILSVVVSLGLGGPEARLKRGPSDDIIIVSQP